MQALVYRVSYMARTQRLSRVSLNPMRNLAYRQQVVMQRSVSTAERPDYNSAHRTCISCRCEYSICVLHLLMLTIRRVSKVSFGASWERL
jgi:hypothetical protein